MPHLRTLSFFWETVSTRLHVWLPIFLPAAAGFEIPAFSTISAAHAALFAAKLCFAFDRQTLLAAMPPSWSAHRNGGREYLYSGVSRPFDLTAWTCYGSRDSIHLT